MAIVELRTRIRAPVERCFDLARSIDLHVRSTAGTSERAVGGITSGLIGDGEHVTFRARHFGMWREMTNRITVFDPPRHFRDSMVTGPFRRFDHDHLFEEVEPGTTLMIDRYDFAFRWGPLGPIIDELLLRPHFSRFLARRNDVVRAVAESEEWRQYLRAKK